MGGDLLLFSLWGSLLISQWVIAGYFGEMNLKGSLPEAPVSVLSQVIISKIILAHLFLFLLFAF